MHSLVLGMDGNSYLIRKFISFYKKTIKPPGDHCRIAEQVRVTKMTSGIPTRLMEKPDSRGVSVIEIN